MPHAAFQRTGLIPPLPPPPQFPIFHFGTKIWTKIVSKIGVVKFITFSFDWLRVFFAGIAFLLLRQNFFMASNRNLGTRDLLILRPQRISSIWVDKSKSELTFPMNRPWICTKANYENGKSRERMPGRKLMIWHFNLLAITRSRIINQPVICVPAPNTFSAYRPNMLQRLSRQWAT